MASGMGRSPSGVGQKHAARGRVDARANNMPRLFCALLPRRSNPYTLRPTHMTHQQQQQQQKRKPQVIDTIVDDELEDRDYANRLLPRAAYRGPALGSVTLWIIAINVVVFATDILLIALGFYK